MTETGISGSFYPFLVLPPGKKKPLKRKSPRANENNLPVFWSYSSRRRWSALLILKSAVWIIRILEKTCKTKQDYIYHFLTSITQKPWVTDLAVMGTPYNKTKRQFLSCNGCFITQMLNYNNKLIVFLRLLFLRLLL